MLKIVKSTAIEGISSTEDGQQIATFYANINENGTNNTMNVMDQALYDANKKKVRADKREFDDYVYTVEDAEGEG